MEQGRGAGYLCGHLANYERGASGKQGLKYKITAWRWLVLELLEFFSILLKQ